MTKYRNVLLVTLFSCLLIASCETKSGTVAVTDAGPSDGATGTCGNGKVDGNELCDGDDLHGETCMSATQGVMTGGTLACSKSCHFDLAACSGGDDGGSDDGGNGNGGAGG